MTTVTTVPVETVIMAVMMLMIVAEAMVMMVIVMMARQRLGNGDGEVSSYHLLTFLQDLLQTQSQFLGLL